MMLQYIPPLALQDRHVELLMQSEYVKPRHEQRTELEVINAVRQKEWMVFELLRPRGGIVAVSKHGRRLALHALTASGFGSSFRSAVKVLQRLAADLECDAVETMVWDRRLARAMQNVGVRAEAVQMVLRI